MRRRKEKEERIMKVEEEGQEMKPVTVTTMMTMLMN
jgi:hypothetical protein